MAIKSLYDLEVTDVEGGIEGLKILFYGKNTLGKTPQAMKFPKSLLLMGETGGSAIKGYKKHIKRKKDFIEVVAELTNDKTIDNMKDKFQTIIIDTVEDIIDLFETALAREYGVKDVGEIQQKEKGNPNGYTVSRRDFKQQILLLTGCGYTVIFIAHDEVVEVRDEDGKLLSSKIQPKGSKGEKSSSRFIKDLCDFRFYIKGNGVDPETNTTIMSTAWCVETPEFYAGSRFPIQSFVNPFTADNIIKAIIKAQEKSAEEQDSKLSVFSVDTSAYTKEDYFNIIHPYFNRLYSLYPYEATDIVESQLGEKIRISQATDDNLIELENIYCNLVSFACDRGVVIN